MTKPKATPSAHSHPSGGSPDLDAVIRGLIAELESKMHHFMDEEHVTTHLRGRDRLRLFGAGVRNYGFIDKAFDIARDNPTFMPPNFDVERLYGNIRELEDLRQLSLVMQQFAQIVDNCLLLKADLCYRDALRIYGALREQSRARVPGAEPLFDALRTFFHRRRNTTGEETEKELEKDYNRLIHGKADGEIIVENESPHVSGGIHKVIDNVHKGKSAFKEVAEGEVDEGMSSTKKK